jgi:hypothetical protein
VFECFGPQLGQIKFDLEPMKFNHKLADHPALSLESLSKALPELPKHQVMYSKGPIEHKNGLRMEDAIETIKVSNSYIAVKNPEEHPSFRDLFYDLEYDLTKLIKMKKKGVKAKDAMLCLFIASPNTHTPFHFDQYTNFLMQFRGSKEIDVFPPLDQRVVSAEDYEAFIDQNEKQLTLKPEVDHLAQKFQFSTGEAMHIPFGSAHHVKNGPDDVSISLSMLFHTDETLMLTNAMRMNYRLRRRMKEMGIQPGKVGKSSHFDLFKARILPGANLANNIISRFR